jgi:hypothetical protein
MMAGLLLPERPIGNMYFAAWSHNVIQNTVLLCNDLKMGEYRMWISNVLLINFGLALNADQLIQSRSLPE